MLSLGARVSGWGEGGARDGRVEVVVVLVALGLRRVCVCVRAREREVRRGGRERLLSRGGGLVESFVLLPLASSAVFERMAVVCVLWLCVCVCGRACGRAGET